jgi:hypothetical protein
MSEERVIICRGVKDGMKPGSRAGYECAICAEPLQVTSGGLGMLEQYPRSTLLCTECGLLYVHLAEDSGHGIARIEMSPQAKSQLAAGNKSPLARWIRKRA